MKASLSLNLWGMARALAVTAVTCLLVAWAGTARAQTEPTLPADANTTCPVMPEEPSDPEIYVDHEGRRVYLCCMACKRSFKKDPEKYMKLLPDAGTAKGDSTTTPSATGTDDSATTGAREGEENAPAAPLSAAIRAVPPGRKVESTNAGEAPQHSSAPPVPRISSLERAVRYSGRLHAVSVHFPIGLLLGAAAVEAVAVVRRRPIASEGARVTLALGTAGALVAVPLGWVNAAFNQNPGMEHYVEWHRWLGTTAGAAAVTAWMLARRARSGSLFVEKIYLTALFASALLLIVAGHFGAALIYGPDYLKP